MTEPDELIPINGPDTTTTINGNEYWVPMVYVHSAKPRHTVKPGIYTLASVVAWIGRVGGGGPRSVEVARSDEFEAALAEAGVPFRRKERVVATYVYTRDRPMGK